MSQDDKTVIATNLKNLIDLNNQSFAPASGEIDVVNGYLETQDNHDNGFSLFSNLLFSAVGLIGNIEGIPAAPVIAWFLSAVVNSFNTTSQPELFNPFPQIKARFIATSLAIDTKLTTILNDLDNQMDTTLTIPDFIQLPPPYNNKKTITVRELANYNIPALYSNDFETCKDKFVFGFRNELVKQNLPTINKYGIGTIHKRDMGRYNIYVMVAPGDSNDPIYTWSQDNLTINSTDTQLQSAGHDVSVSGSSVEDFNKTAGAYATEMGGALVVPVANSGSSIDYHKYYMFTGYQTGEHSGWDLSDDDFYNWLFQDDGFGNITRPDSVGLRNDIFRNWGIINGTKIPQSVPTAPDVAPKGTQIASAYPEESGNTDIFSWFCSIV